MDSVMDHYKSTIDCPEDWHKDDARALAESVFDYFSELVAILETQLTFVPDTDARERLHIEGAKATAERGLELGRQLVELLKSPD